MNEAVRHRRVWKTLCFLARVPFEKIFAYSHDTQVFDKPVLVVANHVTNYDPLLVALSFPKNMLYFVASEHLFRLGWVSRLISWLVSPIARRKGSKGFDAAMNCLRKLKAGYSVCLFAEGETTWDGVSQPIYPATGMLARAGGCALVTYRLEGGYLTAPRWGKGIRRGRMHGHVVGLYPPEELKGMKDKEIEALINRDLHEDAWERQKTEKNRFRSAYMAERLEVALCLCPECRRIGALKSEGNRLHCACGMEARLNEYGLFENSQPFETIREWNAWQQEQLISRSFVHEKELFSDENLTLFEILEGHQAQEMETGRLSADEQGMTIGTRRFAYADVQDLALVTGRKILFTCGDHYYELRAPEPICLRKYLTVWQSAAKE